MSHEREVFPILEDIENEIGAVVHKVNEGDSPLNNAQNTKKNGIIGFSFKDSAGNLVLPTLNNEGAVPVVFDAGTTFRAHGQNINGDSTNKMTLASITLSLETVYTKISAIGSCFRDTEFEIVLINDSAGTPSETIIGNFLTGPGQFTTKFDLSIDEFNTIGFTGVPLLVLRAINLNRESKTMGQISVNEIAGF